MFGKFCLSVLLLAIPLSATLMFRDIEGDHALQPLDPSGPAEILFFITNDCPISNSYAPEIQRICGDYSAKGVSCALVYSDPSLDAAGIRKHFSDYGYKEPIAAFSDTTHKLAHATGATITPEAVIVAKRGKVMYRGRIDNFYAGLGKPRRFATVHDVRDALDQVLAGKPVTHPQTQAVGCYIPQ